MYSHVRPGAGPATRAQEEAPRRWGARVQMLWARRGPLGWARTGRCPEVTAAPEQDIPLQFLVPFFKFMARTENFLPRIVYVLQTRMGRGNGCNYKSEGINT